MTAFNLQTMKSQMAACMDVSDCFCIVLVIHFRFPLVPDLGARSRTSFWLKYFKEKMPCFTALVTSFRHRTLNSIHVSLRGGLSWREKSGGLSPVVKIMRDFGGPPSLHRTCFRLDKLLTLHLPKEEMGKGTLLSIAEECYNPMLAFSFCYTFTYAAGTRKLFS